MPIRQHDRLLLIAARNPVAGETKTRLGATIGMACAAQLYGTFLHDLVDRFMTADLSYDLGWAYTPESHPFRVTIERIQPDRELDHVHFVMQEGSDWAARQAMLLRWGAEQGYAATVLTASDSPQMTRAMVDDAFAGLDAADVVVGRVHDGGYYLIGVRGFLDVVTGVPMSTTTAARDLISQARRRGLDVATIESTFDIDVEADLRLLADLCESDPGAAPMTCKALDELGLFARIAARDGREDGT
ncbi:MAG: DUF2064 domain-containing protein [Thermomicrobiales bacterium]